ncbi:MAG: dTDP-glucose 4,6-dehydratase [Chitinivibrionales bacterium]|nr:dTDP-glucose 4,6-dehydratase [Chitinivibrionales bacterium]MBD3358943.1 dTDP-glucose 4,6-dehydratase [Chitinivibrionales bacterium]
MNTLLVTGGYGFIGSNFIRYMLEQRGEWAIVNLDKVTYAGNPANLADLESDARLTNIHGDICDRSTVESLFEHRQFKAVVHFAAESHVDRSITGPEQFILTNVLGTQVLLDVARHAWDGMYDDRAFVHVSTDEVYGALKEEGYFTESTPLAPNSPYSASKAGSDLIVRSYHKTYGFPATITRCSNNYGPYQFPEKLIPLMITNALHDKPLPVYGDGLYVRDWLYVIDHCRAIEAVLTRGRRGEVYNIGGNNERKNIDLVKSILDLLGKPHSLIEHVTDRLGHDRRYAIDPKKITKELGWTPTVKPEEGLELTVRWYLENREWWENLLRRKDR